nr:hypothetical protein [Gammaproteobacteria bacterium]
MPPRAIASQCFRKRKRAAQFFRVASLARAFRKRIGHEPFGPWRSADSVCIGYGTRLALARS